MNYFVLGPFSVRTSTKGLAKWGFPVIGIGPLSLFSRDSGGGFILASYHPRKCTTWHWSVSIIKSNGKGGRTPKERRRNQWFDRYPLPFGRQLVIAQQDYHRSERTTRFHKEGDE